MHGVNPLCCFWGSRHMAKASIFIFIILSLAQSKIYFRKDNYDFLNCSCGRFQSENRLIDGVAIKDAQYPWLVGILNGNSPKSPVHSPLCFGVLISDRHVLTAASCVHKKKIYDISVYFYGKDIPSIVRRRRSVRDMDIHEKYHSLNHDNNLAILLLAIPIELEKKSINISPICIPNPFLFSGNVKKGLMTKMQFFKTILVASPKFYFGSISLKIHGVRNPSCSNIFTERPKDSTLCQQLNGHCYGDQGSPLTILLSETGKPVTSGGRYHVLGIYSKGYGCDGFLVGKSGVDVSTNIMNHTDWIIRKTIRTGNFCS